MIGENLPYKVKWPETVYGKGGQFYVLAFGIDKCGMYWRTIGFKLTKAKAIALANETTEFRALVRKGLNGPTIHRNEKETLYQDRRKK